MTNPTTSHAYWVPIAPSDLTQIADLLRARDVFTPTFSAAETDRYDPMVYRHQAERFATSTRLLVDRNLLSRWVGLVNGVAPQEAHRLAAGVMAFAQCAHIDIEPNIALYEVAHLLGLDAARDELATFRFADHTHPGYWAEVALGQAHEVVAPERLLIPATDDTVNFAMPLRRWRRNYVLSLKLVELDLEGGSSSARMSRLLGWMYDDFILGGPAIALAATYLAPNAERRGLLKGIRSADRERALEGARNAAWDLTLVSEWLKAAEHQQAESRLTLLASLDRAVHTIARTVGDIKEAHEATGTQMAEVLTRLWGESVGARLASEVTDYYSTREADHRQINRPTEVDFLSKCVRLGEQAVRDWSPRRGNA
jgi:hypothetical protein